MTMDNPGNPVVWLRNSGLLGWLGRGGLVPYFVGATMGRGRLVRAVREAGLEVEECTAMMHCFRMAAVGISGWLDKHAGAAVQRGVDKVAGAIRVAGAFADSVRYGLLCGGAGAEERLKALGLRLKEEAAAGAKFKGWRC